jgi:hypothetical protein
MKFDCQVEIAPDGALTIHITKTMLEWLQRAFIPSWITVGDLNRKRKVNIELPKI